MQVVWQQTIAINTRQTSSLNMKHCSETKSILGQITTVKARAHSVDMMWYCDKYWINQLAWHRNMPSITHALIFYIKQDFKIHKSAVVNYFLCVQIEQLLTKHDLLRTDSGIFMKGNISAMLLERAIWKTFKRISKVMISILTETE